MATIMIELPYVFAVVRKGLGWVYYRRKGKYYPLPPVTDPTFKSEYDRVHRSFEIGRAPSIPGSFAKLVEDYKSEPEFLEKAPKTQKDYRRYMDALAGTFGDLPVRSITRKGVLALRKRLADKPRTANYYMQVLSILLNYAIDQDIIKVNPARRPKRLKTGPGYKPWRDEDIVAYLDANKDDARALIALDIGQYTGQREGDCIKMTVKAWDGRFIEVTQNKGGERLWIPAHPKLRPRLDALSKDRLLLMVTKTGRAYKEDFFRHEFRAWADKAVEKGAQTGLTFHGLRKTATIRLLEAGCTHAQVKAITGHRTDATVSLYGKDASKKVLALQAMDKLDVAER
ncbi:MAG: tyrosine-type recombinase/integrase [Fimbriimonadaceae bacterium]